MEYKNSGVETSVSSLRSEVLKAVTYRIWHRSVWWKFTDVLEKRTEYIFRLEKKAYDEMNRRYASTLTIEVLFSSEIQILTLHDTTSRSVVT
jgi:hypothetical protein